MCQYHLSTDKLSLIILDNPDTDLSGTDLAPVLHTVDTK